MNIYLVERKSKYYGSGATNRMVVVAADENAAREMHHDRDYKWDAEHGMWVDWSNEDMYLPKRWEWKWPAPDDLNVSLLGTADNAWLLFPGAIILTDTQR